MKLSIIKKTFSDTPPSQLANLQKLEKGLESMRALQEESYKKIIEEIKEDIKNYDKRRQKDIKDFEAKIVELNKEYEKAMKQTKDKIKKLQS